MAIKFSSEIQFSCISELSALGDRADNPCLPQGTLLPPEIFIDMVSRRQLTLSRESLQQGFFFPQWRKKSLSSQASSVNNDQAHCGLWSLQQPPLFTVNDHIFIFNVPRVAFEIKLFSTWRTDGLYKYRHHKKHLLRTNSPKMPGQRCSVGGRGKLVN